jgi:hypothetical protein
MSQPRQFTITLPALPSFPQKLVRPLKLVGFTALLTGVFYGGYYTGTQESQEVITVTSKEVQYVTVTTTPVPTIDLTVLPTIADDRETSTPVPTITSKPVVKTVR